MFCVFSLHTKLIFTPASLGPSYPNIANHIDSTLQSLGLASIANNRIGTPLQRGISGGQKRRVTIACSVVAKPRVLVLDEPTSGLDATSGKEVVAFRGSLCVLSLVLYFSSDSLALAHPIVRRLAKEQNVLVVCTIHQPNFDTFSLFDRLLLLAGGQVMYDGETGASRYISLSLSCWRFQRWPQRLVSGYV